MSSFQVEVPQEGCVIGAEAEVGSEAGEKDCQVPENVSQVFDKVQEREGPDEGGSRGDKEASFVEGLLQIKVFYLMCLPVLLWMKVIRFTFFLFSFLLLDNWMKQLVESLTTFLLGNNLVSRGV